MSRFGLKYWHPSSVGFGWEASIPSGMPGYMPTRFRLVDQQHAYQRNAEAHAKKLQEFLRDNEATIAQFHTSMLHQHALSKLQVWRIVKNYPHMTLEGRVTHGRPEVMIEVLYPELPTPDNPDYVILEFVWPEARGWVDCSLRGWEVGYSIPISFGPLGSLNASAFARQSESYVRRGPLGLPERVSVDDYVCFREEYAANPIVRLETDPQPLPNGLVQDPEWVGRGRGSQFDRAEFLECPDDIELRRLQLIPLDAERLQALRATSRGRFSYTWTSPTHRPGGNINSERLTPFTRDTPHRAISAVVAMHKLPSAQIKVHWYWDRQYRRMDAAPSVFYLVGDDLPAPPQPPLMDNRLDMILGPLTVFWNGAVIYDGSMPGIWTEYAAPYFALLQQNRAEINAWRDEVHDYHIVGVNSLTGEEIFTLCTHEDMLTHVSFPGTGRRMRWADKDSPTPPTPVEVRATFIGNLPRHTTGDGTPDLQAYWDNPNDSRWRVSHRVLGRFTPGLALSSAARTSREQMFPDGDFTNYGPIEARIRLGGWGGGLL